MSAELIALVSSVAGLGGVAWTVLTYIPKLMIEAYGRFEGYNAVIDERFRKQEGEIEKLSCDSIKVLSDIEKLEMRLEYKIEMGHGQVVMSLDRINEMILSNQKSLAAMHKRLDNIDKAGKHTGDKDHG